jgi:1-acyl-sn-glycerol-3-phosphate acyltransferase
MWYKIGKMFLWPWFIFYMRLDVKGRENVPKKGGFILVSNHVSNLDPIALGLACPGNVNFMAKEELFHPFFWGWILRLVNCFPLKRKGADLWAIREAIRRVSHGGGGLLIFPEGTRSLDGKLGKGQEGVGFLVDKLNVPVIPAFVKGTLKAMPKGAVFPRPLKISVEFGKQIPLERRVAYSDVAVKVMQAIKQLSCCESS